MQKAQSFYPLFSALTPPRASFEDQAFLLAEDHTDDAFLLQRAFRTAGIGNPLHVVPDGQEAMDYLGGVGAYADRSQHPLPEVVLLDLDLPRKNGFEVLRWLRSQAALQAVVAIILTGSNCSADADRAYELGANFYLTKPGTFDELVTLTRCLHEWLQSNPAPARALTANHSGQVSRLPRT
jgi:CheY-like chemotaxis protein